MSDGQVDGGMIEIGDPTEEPRSSEEHAPKVVIQYHERGGVPWMLIPPLLVASAVGAVLAYHKLAPRPAPVPALVRSDEPLVAPVASPTPRIAEAEAESPLALPPAPVEAEAVAPAAAPVVPEPAPMPTPPVPSPRVDALGFDPKALEADRRAEAPADPALAAAARDLPPEPRDQPREVDPDLLPPDPRLAKARQQQRRVDALKKVEDDRARFHAELREVCRKLGESSAPAIHELQKKYGLRVEPAAGKRAAQLLGKSGKFVGADRRTRIELLRSLGYPEPVILGDLFDTYGVKLINGRDGPRSEGEALYVSALYLLRNAPPPAANPAPTPALGLAPGPAR